MIDTALRTLVGDGTRDLDANAGPLPIDGTPALGVSAAALPDEPATTEETAEGLVLANDALRVVVDQRGLLTSIRDLTADREVLGAPANMLQLFRDTPTRWDAWDVDLRDRRVGRDLVDATVTVDERVVRIERSTGAVIP